MFFSFYLQHLFYLFISIYWFVFMFMFLFFSLRRAYVTLLKLTMRWLVQLFDNNKNQPKQIPFRESTNAFLFLLLFCQ